MMARKNLADLLGEELRSASVGVEPAIGSPVRAVPEDTRQTPEVQEHGSAEVRKVATPQPRHSGTSGVAESRRAEVPQYRTPGVQEARRSRDTKVRTAGLQDSGTPGGWDSGRSGLRKVMSPPAPAAASRPKYLRLERKDARLTERQLTDLIALARYLNRQRPTGVGERLTENTLLRLAVDLLLERADDLSGTTEDELRASVGLGHIDC